MNYNKKTVKDIDVKGKKVLADAAPGMGQPERLGQARGLLAEEQPAPV